MFDASFSGTIVPSRSISPDPAIMITATYFPSAFGLVSVPCKVNSLLMLLHIHQKSSFCPLFFYIQFKFQTRYYIFILSYIFHWRKTGFSAILCNMLRFIISSFLTVLAPSGNSANHSSIASK